jgi:hypothetical protein
MQVAPDETLEPEPYEPGPPTTHQEAQARMSAPPRKEDLAERHARFAKPRKPMGPAPDDERRKRDEEHNQHADVPPTPPPQPASGTEPGG